MTRLSRISSLLLLSSICLPAPAATTLRHYYAHEPKIDRHGVIAPWYQRQNGQFDYRVRIAAETLKRYPWTNGNQQVPRAPEYVYNGFWSVDQEGGIQPGQQNNWINGDLPQRAVYVISSFIDYYRYSGDPAAIAPITAMADYLVDYCQTAETHGWPRMLISVPNMGALYGRCQLGTNDPDPKSREGKIQLDIVAQVGLEMLRAYQMLGNERWLEAVKHWADLLARNRQRDPSLAPWGRYAKNSGGNGMVDKQTGGISIILSLFDELIRVGYTGKDNSLVDARNAGRDYLRNELLPAWTVVDTWGRNYWDWEAHVQELFGTEFTVLYMMANKSEFPNWKNDVRNILSLFLNHTGANPISGGDVYHGAWAYPESSGCCDRSLWYSPLQLASIFARFGKETGDAWALEISRRSQILATYDPLGDGQSRDAIDGGVRVAGLWFKIAHPMAMKHVLRSIGWQPEIMGANRENHVVRTASVVKNVFYRKGDVAYATFDAPANSVDVLRLSFAPASVEADGKPLATSPDLSRNGYRSEALPGGDYIVTLRHDGATRVRVTGGDPQSMTDDKQLRFEGKWQADANAADHQGGVHTARDAGAALTFKFTGNQVRLIGRCGPSAGIADVYVDDFRQLTPIDFYCPSERHQQVLFYKNGLQGGAHTLRIAARGAGNPVSKGAEVNVDAIEYSNATGDSGFGEGGGPTGTQRLVLGYGGRKDVVDSKGNQWKPGMEFIARAGRQVDTVARTWWLMAQAMLIHDTPDQELYRYGAHWSDFTVNLTVAPGTYYVRLKFAESEYDGANQRAMSILVNGKRIVDGFDVFATAGRKHRAVDLVFDKLEPKNGVIDIRFIGNTINGRPTEAMVKAIELGQGEGGTGATPKTSPIAVAADIGVLQ